MPFFSVIIPTYNRAAFLKKAVDSVLQQTFLDWELIVIDDASTDDTTNLLSTYKDTRITCYRNEINRERSSSRNKGIGLAQGEYICFLDSDDYFLPRHLTLLAETIILQSNAEALFHTAVRQSDVVKGERIIERPLLKNAVEDLLTCHIPVISVAIHKEILLKIKFDERLKINEDVQLFSHIASRYPVFYIPEITVVWVLHGNNTVDYEEDYLTPQLIATRQIFSDSSVIVSKSFKTNKYFDLYSQLVYFHATRKRAILSWLYFLKGLLTDPVNKNNVTNLLNVIYHLPGGKWIKKSVNIFNSF